MTNRHVLQRRRQKTSSLELVVKANISCSFIERSFFFSLLACYEPSHFLYLSFSGYYTSFFFFSRLYKNARGQKKKMTETNKRTSKR